VEQRRAGEREDEQDARVPPQQRRLGAQAGKREGRERQRRDQPAQEIERQRVERVAQRAPGDPVP
jgi:hypothetical protein